MRARKGGNSVAEAMANGSFPHDNAAIKRGIIIYTFRTIIIAAWKLYEPGEYPLMLEATRIFFGEVRGEPTPFEEQLIAASGDSEAVIAS